MKNTDRSTAIFEEYRSLLFQIAYGMLGRVATAKDIVQEAYLRWHGQDPDSIASHRAYLTTIVSRLCLDELKSARHRREQYVGPDLPEPILPSDRNSPLEQAELSDMLTIAMMRLMRQLTPVQRAVYILREVLDYNYEDISGIVDKSAAHCRKIAQRARDHLNERRPRFEVDRDAKKRLLQQFQEAVEQGEIQELERILARDARLYSDGGGNVTAARKPISGSGNIARFLMGIRRKSDLEDIEIEKQEINGSPGMLVRVGGKLQSVWSFEMAPGEIRTVFVVLNPEKIGHLEP